MQFGFSDRGAHIYLPHQYVPNTVAYTGTHDNDTTLGWWKNGATAEEREHVQRYLQPIEQDEEIVGAMMRAAARSVARLCIFPMQDVLRLGSEARMNTPANRLGNWGWRYDGGRDEAGDGGGACGVDGADGQGRGEGGEGKA